MGNCPCGDSDDDNGGWWWNKDCSLRLDWQEQSCRVLVGQRKQEVKCREKKIRIEFSLFLLIALEDGKGTFSVEGRGSSILR
jgi:hypothetical protein